MTLLLTEIHTYFIAKCAAISRINGVALYLPVNLTANYTLRKLIVFLNTIVVLENVQPCLVF